MKKRGLFIVCILILATVLAVQITTFTNNLSEETLNFSEVNNYTRNLSIWRNPIIDYGYINLSGRFRLNNLIDLEKDTGATLSTDYNGNTITRKNDIDTEVFDIFYVNGTFRKNLTLDSTFADYLSIAIEEDIFWASATESGGNQMMYEYDFYGNRLSSVETGTGTVVNSKYNSNALWTQKANKLEKWNIDRTYSESILNLEVSYGNFYGMSISGGIIYQIDDRGSSTWINKYYTNGSYIESYDVGLGGNGAIKGIDVGDDILLSYDSLDEIVKLNLNGTYLENYSLSAGNEDPRGISRIDNNIYVLDDIDNKIYSYYENGTEIGNCQLVDNLDYRGMTSIGDYLYISLDSSSYDLYKIDKNCNFIKYIDLNSSSSSFFYGVSYDSGKFYSSKVFGSDWNISETTISSSLENSLNLTINNISTFDLYSDEIIVMFSDGRMKNYPISGNILEGDYKIENFTTYGNRGIATNGTNIWSLNYNSDLVYIYESDGTYTGQSFSTYISNSNPSDITTDNTFIYITDNWAGGYYKYYMNGTYTGEFVDLSAIVTLVFGITTDGLNIYVSEVGGTTISKCYMNGTYTGTSYDLSGSLSSIWALETNGTYIWATDSTDNKVHRITIDGLYQNGFNLITTNTFPYGILVDETQILVNDFVDETVYKYNKLDTTYTDLLNTTITNNTFLDLSIVEDEIWLYDYYTENYTNYNLYSVSNARIDIGDLDGDYEFERTGRYYANEKTNNFSSKLISILNSGDCDCSECEINVTDNNCIIPFTFFGSGDLLNYSNINISYTIKPYVTLLSPSNNTISSSQKTFNCSSLIDNSLTIDNITLQIWNSSGVLLNSSVKSSSTNYDYLELTQKFTYEDNYVWGCYSYSNESVLSYSKNNYTISVFTNITAIQTLYPDNLFLDTASIVLNYTADNFNKDIDNCSLYGNFSGVWGINQTNSSILNGGVNNFDLVIQDGTYIWNIGCIDNSSLESFSEENKTFTVDTVSPVVEINSISTTQGSQTISFNSVVIDENIGTCKYSIYNNGTIDGLNEEIQFTCNSVKSATVTSFDTFTLRVYSTDLSGNENYTELGFTTSPSEAGEGGGGGGTTTVKPANWTMETAIGVSTYEKSQPVGTSIDRNIQFVNTGETERTITLSCEDIKRDMCNYVTFKEGSFNLPLIKDEILIKTFTTTIPKNITKGEYQFNIIGTDQDGSTQFITATISTGGERLLIETVSKIGLKTEGGFPYWVIFILPFMFLLIVTIKAIPKNTNFKFFLVLGISLGVPLVLVYIL